MVKKTRPKDSYAISIEGGEVRLLRILDILFSHKQGLKPFSFFPAHRDYIERVFIWW